MWILIFTLWVMQPDNSYKEEQTRTEYATAEECSQAGQEKLATVGAVDPATYYCFKKGEDLG